MNELLTNIFDKWKEASINNWEQVSFTINYSSTVAEFMKLLETWRVPYNVVHNEFRVCIITMNYWDVMRNKDYYSGNGITAEVEAEYYV